MLSIGNEQFQAMERQSVRSFAGRAADFLKKHFQGAQSVGRGELTEQILPLIDKAQHYGLTGERDVVAYIVTAAYLGRNFDEALEQANVILRRGTDSSAVKAQKLEALTAEIVARLQA